MRKPIHIHVIPAPAGTYDIFLDNKEWLVVGDLIIAFRIETHEEKGAESPWDDSMRSYTFPITLLGDTTSNSIGVLLPDKTVTTFGGTTYLSLAAAKIDYLKKQNGD